MFKYFVLLFLVNCRLSSAAVTLEVNASAGSHAISPYIYGMSFMEDTAFAKEIKLPVDRWGGNAVTRYNYKNDVSNHASDWFFENIPEDNTAPEKLPEGSKVNAFIDKDKSVGAKTIITIPMIGWTPKDRTKSCGFSVKKYGEQQKTDEWMPDCGNGYHTDGKPITGNDPNDISIKINSTFAKEWVQYLVKKYGAASSSGVMFYNLDNEIDLWQSTHRDVHPDILDTDTILKLTEDYGSAIKSADSSAKTLGPVGFNYISVLTSPIDLFGNNSNKDKQAHGNIEFAAYYLKTLKAYEDQHKTRVLDYLDYHYYPQSDNVFSDSTDPNVLSVRLRCTRSLWDPTYTDESWVKDLGDPTSKIQLIPKLKKMISDNYPGTKLAITEYNWGGLKSLNGALAQADVLGIFGREGLDLAALWGPGNATEPWAYAFRMYRNYDGKGGMFGETSVSAKSSDSDSVSIFASTRASDKKLIIIVINKDPSNAVNTKITITGHTHSGTARAFTYSQSSLTKIVESTATMSGNDITHNFPAYSITLFEV